MKINTDVAAQKLKCLKDIVEWVNDSCLLIKICKEMGLNEDEKIQNKSK